MDDNSSQKVNLGDYDLSLDEAIQQAVLVTARDFGQTEKPDLDSLRTVVLYDGKYVKKIAKHWGIRSRNSGQHKYNNLNLITLRRTKKRGWELETDKSITIDDKPENGSVNILFKFLASLPQIDTSGDHIVVNVTDIEVDQFQKILNSISKNQQSIDLISRILDWIENDANATSGLMQLASDKPKQAQSLVAAINYARLSRSLDQFRELVDQDYPERTYQKFLEANYWMFGSEYSRLIPNRNIVRNMQLDFPLRRTVDGYLDIIEIKTPLNGQELFRRKGSRYSEISDVVDAISQADDYLANVDAQQYEIHFHEKLDVEKVRAKVVIGRSGDADQTKSLRRLNARQTRIEIVTFDQLIKIAQRMLDLLVEDNPNIESHDVRVQTHVNGLGVDDIPW